MLRSTNINRTALFMVVIFIIALPIEVIGYSSDMLFIRHGRSRVRHSNEKDHIQWGLQAFDNLTLDYDSYDNETFSSGSGSGSNAGQLFGSEYWLNSDGNGTLINHTGMILKQDSLSSIENETSTNQALSTMLPQLVTTMQPLKNKKKYKKKIMENIRKNVDKGLEYLKSHRNITQDSYNVSVQQILTKNSILNSKPISLKRVSTENVLSSIKSTSERYWFSIPTQKTPTEETNQLGISFTATDEFFGIADNDGSVKATLSKKALAANSNVHIDEGSEKDYELNDDTLVQSPSKSTDVVSTNSYTTSGKRNIKHDIPQELNSSDIFLEEMRLDTLPDESDVENLHSSITSYGEENNGDVYKLYGSTKMETNKYIEGVMDSDGTTDDELYDWDEISRNNRRNLMRGRDVVTKFLQIVETQHSLGSNCEAGTSLNLGEGVVDRYAQDRFRIEAEVAVNRANMLTRIFKMTTLSVQSSVNLLHASVLSMVEFDDDIFAAGNCFDWNQHPSQPGLFCPFAYRLPSPNHGALFAKDLATEYHYLGNTSEWFYLARKNAEKVIARNDQYIRAFHLYSNKTEERVEDETLFVRYEDGRWSKPYYDCGGGNIWMLTYTVPFFGYENGTYFFKGTSGIDIDLRRVDIDQCPQRSIPGATQPLNIFAGTDKCKQRTTMCEAIKGLGFRRGSYKCICRKGYYFPDTLSANKYFNGSILEEEYEKLMLGKNSTYSIAKEYECLPCAEGCDSCEDGSPCIAALNWPMRTSILLLACAIIGLLPPAAWFTFRYQQVKVVRAASPALLRVIAMGAFFIYCTTIVMYPNPSLYTCTARIWLREIGFSLTYGALMLKTWRISVIFRVRSAKAVKITDAALLKRLGIICAVIGTCLLVRTLVSPPEVVVGRTADDLKAFLCKTDWWDYTFTSMEVLFLAWGVRLCIMVRKAPSEFNESRFISMAIYNEFLLTCFLNVSMLFLQSPANPDLLYIIFFCHTQLTVTLLLGLIFGSKVYIVLRSGKSHQESIGMGAKSSGAKFNFRTQVRTFANPSSATTSTAQLETKLSDQEALEEVRLLSIQLQRIQEMAPPKGLAVMTISHLLENLKATSSSQLLTTSTKMQQQTMVSNLPTFSINSDVQKYQNNNCSNLLPITTLRNPTLKVEKSVNTSMTGKDFLTEVIDTSRYTKCDYCAQTENGTKTISCQQLGSPKPEGSISFSNIKLECMCSQPDDLDHICKNDKRKISKEHSITKTAAASTNTTPIFRESKVKVDTSKFHSSSNLVIKNQAEILDKTEFNSNIIGDNYKSSTYNCDKYKSGEHLLICGGCRDKLSNSLKKLSSLESRNCKMMAHRSNEVLDRSIHEELSVITGSFSSATSIIENCGVTTSSLGDLDLIKKNIPYSTDDMTFYTTDDECGERRNDDPVNTMSLNADVPSMSPSCILPDKINLKKKYIPDEGGSQSNLSSASNDIKQISDPARVQRRPDKLLLDLNDRSKYTKEVSV